MYLHGEMMNNFVFRFKKYFKMNKMRKNPINKEFWENILKENEIYYNGKSLFDWEDVFKYFTINIRGKGNKLYLMSQVDSSPHKVTVDISGDDHIFSIGADNHINHPLYVGFYSACRKSSFGSSVIIGSGNKFNGDVSISAPITQGNKVQIGNGNLFANSISFHGNADHLIFDVETKERLNPESDIILENNIWIGQEVRFLNKTYISSNSVIGMRSLVNRPFHEEYCLIAGSPAEVKKKGIMWSEALDDYYITQGNPLV